MMKHGVIIVLNLTKIKMAEKFHKKAPEAPKEGPKKNVEKHDAVPTFDKMDVKNKLELKFAFDDYLLELGFGKKIDLKKVDLSKFRDNLVKAANDFIAVGVKIKDPLVAKTANIVILEYVREKLDGLKAAKEKAMGGLSATLDKVNATLRREKDADDEQKSALEAARKKAEAEEKKKWADFFAGSPKTKKESAETSDERYERRLNEIKKRDAANKAKEDNKG